MANNPFTSMNAKSKPIGANFPRHIKVILCTVMASSFIQATRGQTNSNPSPTLTNRDTATGMVTNTPIEKIPTVVHIRHPGDSYEWNTKTTPPFYTKLKDEVIIDVLDLNTWIEKSQKENPKKDRTIADLVPVLNGVALWGVHPENPGSKEEDDNDLGRKVHHLRFVLDRFSAEESRNAWSHLLNQPVGHRRVQVSLGFEDGVEMPTWIDNVDARGAYQCFLSVVPAWPFSVGIIIIGGALFIFLLLAYKTPIVRDTTAPLRPDGKSPYSLGRAQMAFWFFLIIAAFFLLWVITHDMDTVNSSALTLMGISAGTALGAAIIDAGKNNAGDVNRYVADVDLKSKISVHDQLEQRLELERSTLKSLQTAHAGILAKDTEAVANSENLQSASKKRISILKRQIEFFSLAPWRVVMYDLLADDNMITFHRFQIFVWTIVLGIIFIFKVYQDLSMPEFSSTLLALLGISSGTYLGFKLPDRPSDAKNRPDS